MTTGIRVSRFVVLWTAAVVLSIAGVTAQNPYKVQYDWDKLEGRKIGVASGIRLDPDGKHLWILDRCGANGCADSTLDPIIQVDLDGKFVKSFGKGIMNFPHGFFIDREGFIWVTDGAPKGDARGAAGFKKGLGHQIYKFTRDGKLVMRLGEAGVPGDDEKHFNGPTGVVVSRNGDIWITDGHGGPQVGPLKDNMYGSRGGNNRLIRFSKDGNFITRWTQFGKPSAIAIDKKGHIYVADGMSNDHWNPGWERGIRVGDVKTGWIKAFIPDEELTQGAGTEFLGVDEKGRIFSGASGRPGLVVHELFRPLF